MLKKTCKRCKVEKPLNAFPVEYRKTGPSYRHQCKDCRLDDSRKWTEEHREHVNARMRAYNQKHRLRNRLYRYDLTPEQFHQMLADQNNLCKICQKKTEDKTLCVDHCHKTGKTRGLLCRKCNTLISLLDNEPLLEKAIAYVQFYR